MVANNRYYLFYIYQYLKGETIKYAMVELFCNEIQLSLEWMAVYMFVPSAIIKTLMST